MLSSQFKTNFRKSLNKFLTQSGEYRWSSRVEGMLERSEESTAPSKAEILIDGEIDKTTLTEMTEDIFDVLRHSDFRKTKFMVHLWVDNKLEKKKRGNIEFMSLRQLEEVFADMELEDIQSGDANDFKELYALIKKAPLIIFITTEKNRELLQQEKNHYKNILFLDYGNADDNH